MTNDVFISQRTKKSIVDAVKGNQHAILIETPPGEQYACYTSFIEDTAAVKPNTSLVIKKLDKNIGVDQIKSLKAQFKLKSGKNETRLAFVYGSQNMTLEAQNALLKLLEEPPESSIFILFTDSISQLLPTIISRCASIIAIKPSKSIVANYFLSHGYSISSIEKALALSDGWPELAESILLDKDTEFTKEISYVKNLLQMSLTSKLREVDTLSKEKQRLPLILYILERLSRSANSAHISKHDSPNERWFKIMQNVEYSHELLRHNVNTKLVLTNLMINI